MLHPPTFLPVAAPWLDTIGLAVFAASGALAAAKRGQTMVTLAFFALITGVGGGLAGSVAAAMLGRAGIAAVLIDPHETYPPELRCEKISGGQQLERLRRTGLADAMLAISSHDEHIWLARFGRLIDIRPSQQYGFLYDTFVNAVRGAIPPAVDRIRAKAWPASARP
eukprot:gene1074-1456_t